jgi:hypothetical protein
LLVQEFQFIWLHFHMHEMADFSHVPLISIWSFSARRVQHLPRVVSAGQQVQAEMRWQLPLILHCQRAQKDSRGTPNVPCVSAEMGINQ